MPYYSDYLREIKGGKMIILQVCAFGAPSPGNFLRSLYALDDELQKKGIETIYAFAETARNREWCKELCKNRKVYFLPVRHARVKIETYKILKQIFAENKIYIVHSHFELYDIPVVATAPKETKVYWHLHDAIKSLYFKANYSRKLLYKLQYAYFSKNVKILSVSQEHGQFITKLGCNKDNVIYIPNGIDINRIHSFYRGNTCSNFLLFGWEIERKGVDLVIKADRLLEKDFQAKIVIVGQDSCEEYLKQEDTQHIEFHRPVSDINELYDASDCFLHVSRSEGMSYALLEAIYAGLSVICSDIPENEVGRMFPGVYFVPSGDYKSISDEIRRLVEEKSFISRDQYQRNKRIIEESFSVDSWVKNVVTRYEL